VPLEKRGGISKLEAMSLFSSGGRGRAATAALLSSIFPGAGQAYNGQWLKAFVAAALALSLLLVLATSLASVLAAAGANLIAADGVLTPASMERQLIPAMMNEAILTDIRARILPSAVLLLAVGLWSVIDGYRVARRRTPPSAAC